mmetsp:Transcript_12340/g.10939  ORF Transcript_12340/g.10939 Transcript_12340/m.10939 type:complete len:154 (-) Transcript_12340:77-538(-)
MRSAEVFPFNNNPDHYQQVQSSINNYSSIITEEIKESPEKASSVDYSQTAPMLIKSETFNPSETLVQNPAVKATIYEQKTQPILAHKEIFVNKELLKQDRNYIIQEETDEEEESPKFSQKDITKITDIFNDEVPKDHIFLPYKIPIMFIHHKR